MVNACHKATQLDTKQKWFTFIHKSASKVRMSSQLAAKYIGK